MGNMNCNSSTDISQRCTACGIKTCDCTAGLDGGCKTCDPSYKYNIPGTYDDQYNAWLRNNPRPVKPVFDPQPDITAGDFICTQCTQCQEFSNISGQTVKITDPTQTMSCIGKIEAAINSQQAAEAAARAEAEARAKWEAQQAAAAVIASDPTMQATPANINWMLILLIMLVIMLASIIGYFVFVDEDAQKPTQTQQAQQVAQ